MSRELWKYRRHLYSSDSFDNSEHYDNSHSAVVTVVKIDKNTKEEEEEEGEGEDEGGGER